MVTSSTTPQWYSNKIKTLTRCYWKGLNCWDLKVSYTDNWNVDQIVGHFWKDFLTLWQVSLWRVSSKSQQSTPVPWAWEEVPGGYSTWPQHLTSLHPLAIFKNCPRTLLWPPGESGHSACTTLLCVDHNCRLLVTSTVTNVCVVQNSVLPMMPIQVLLYTTSGSLLNIFFSKSISIYTYVPILCIYIYISLTCVNSGVNNREETEIDTRRTQTYRNSFHWRA